MRDLSPEDQQLRLRLIREGTVRRDAELCDLGSLKVHLRDVNLRPHQLQTIGAMRALEEPETSASGETVVTELGILSNKVGSGKSLCVLGAVALRRRLQTRACVTYHFDDSVFVMQEACARREVSLGNLIVVPNYLTSMWEDYVTRYTTGLKHLTVGQGMFPLREPHLTELPGLDVVVCGASNYNLLMRTCVARKWVWSRVVFDETDTLNIAACVRPATRFVWMVSSSLPNLLFSHGPFWMWDEQRSHAVRVVTRGLTSGSTGYLKSTLQKLGTSHANRILRHIVVKLEDRYVDEQLRLPAIREQVHRCVEPVALRVVHAHVPDVVRDMLNGHDDTGALEGLGCVAAAPGETVVSYLCKSLRVQIRNLQAKTEYLRGLEKPCERDVSVQQKIDRTESKIEDFKNRLQRIMTNVCGDKCVTETADQMRTSKVSPACPICLDTTTDSNRCVSTCCLNCFCVQCVQALPVEQQASCPLCRGRFDALVCSANAVDAVEEEDVEEVDTARPPPPSTKHDVMIELLRQILAAEEHEHEASKKILMFMWNDNSLARVRARLDEHGIPSKTLTGTSRTIGRLVKWFHVGKIPVLLVNASAHRCGLDLSAATHVILFQRFCSETERQILGRAHRLGRTAELHIHRLLHQNEIDA